MGRHEAFPRLRRDAFAALRPPVAIDLAAWIESQVRLPATVAAESGRMRLFPWQVEVARSIGDPAVERVSIMKAARVGASQLMVAGLGHFAVNDPALQLVVLPSESDCRMMTTSVIEPTFAASPALRNVLATDPAGRSNMLERHFPGGRLSLVSGASPKNLRARTARVLWVDEVDALDVDAGGEGDPVALAIRRTMSFASSRKIVMMSTPVDEATSRIARAYAEGDCRIWELPCPHCATWHEPEWGDIRWPEGEPEKAFYCCPSCGGVVEEGPQKAAMIAAGRWRATRPEVQGHHSYRLSTFAVSTLVTASWGTLATEFVAAKRDPFLLKTFVNTVLGSCWRDDSEGLDESDLLSRREPIGLDRIPAEVLALTGGLDVQGDRIELATLGWTAEGAPLVLAHEIYWGDPLQADNWLAIADALGRTFRHPNGGTLRYDAALIDSGDGNTVEAVYGFCRGRAAQRIFPCKGVAGWRQAPLTLGQARDKTVRLQLVGVDPLKERIMGLAQSGAMRFSDSLAEAWFEQFTAERLRTRYYRGFAVREWHRLSGRRSEALDCVTYAVAARSAVRLDPEKRAAELASAAAPRKAPAVSHSRWMSI